MFVIIITNDCESAWVMGGEFSKSGMPLPIRRFSDSETIEGGVPWGVPRSSAVQKTNHPNTYGDSDDDSDDNDDEKEDSDFDYKQDEDDSDDDECTNEGQAMKAVVNGMNREFVHAELPRFFVSDLTTDSKIYLYSNNWYVVLGDRVKRLDPDSYQVLKVITKNMLITHICGKELTPPLPYTSAN